MADDAQERKAGDPGGKPVKGSGAMPEGIRVVRRHRKRRSKSKGSRETLFLKKREILREMHEEEGSAVNVKEQVRRLKDLKKPEKVPLEERWGSRKHRRRGTRWILLVVSAVVIPVLAILVGVSLLRGPKVEPTIHVPDTGLNLDENESEFVPFDSTSPVAWFQNNSVEAFDEATRILDRVGSVAEIPAEFLRDAERTQPLISDRGIGWDSPFAVGDPRTLAWHYSAAGDTGFMAIWGRRENLEPFRAYFVRTAQGLRLDWEATTAQSDYRIGDLVAAAPESPVTVRAWVGKQPHFDSETGRGGLFSWYQVLNPERTEFVWAYAPADSGLDRELKALMNYGLIVLDRKDEVRAIIRIVKPQVGFRATEFEIVELITEEWVMP